MDRHLKERLVGAAVLVAAAIILIPEMLSGPHDGTQVQTQLPSGESDASGVKTYTIDLASPNAKTTQDLAAATPTFQEIAPPSKSSKDSSTDDVAPGPKEEKAPTGPQAAGNVEAQDREQRLLREFTEQAKSESRPAEKTVATATTSAKPVPEIAKNSESAKAGAWAVQVASFGVRATSERIASDLKAKGYSSFVMSFATGGQTMYRVRVGPVNDRAAAEALLNKIKPLHPGAAIVPQ